MNKLSEKIKELPVLKWAYAWSQKVILPGFDGVPLIDVARFFVKALQTGTLSTRGAAIAFNFFMAIFPSIIFVFTLLPYIPVDDFQTILLSQLEAILPVEAYQLSKETIEDIINRPRGGLLSVGFISALIFSTNGINALIDAFGQSSIYDLTLPWWKQRLISTFLVLINTSLVLVAISLIIFNEVAMEYLISHDIIHSGFIVFLIQATRWLIIVALFYFAISFIYYFTPSGSNTSHWKFFNAGATFTTFLIIAVSVAFSFYINNFGQYNKLYGSIGTLLVIMLWLNLISTFLIIGFELNASISSAKQNNLR